MKNRFKNIKKSLVSGFTLVEMRDSKILYIFHMIFMLSAFTRTLFINPLTI
ncbi:hypothetical protein ABID29_001396, partial [Streptococcus rupicaprae]